jgi:hypothetical protein
MRLAGAARTSSAGGGGGGGGGASFDEKAMAIRKLNAARAMKTEEIKGLAARQQKAADDATAQTAVKFGLEEQVREQEFENAVRQKQAEARIEAEQTVFKYSQKSKQEIAKNNQARQELKNSPDYSDEEKIRGDRALVAQRLGITMDEVEADPNRWKGPPEQGPGMSWIDEKSGALVRRGDNGQVEVVQRYDQSPKHFQEVAAAKIQAAEVTRSQVLKDNEIKAENEAKSEYRKYLQDFDMEVGKDEDGKPIERSRTLSEINAEVDARFGAPSLGQRSQAQQFSPEVEAQAEADYARMKPGEEFVGPDGVKRRKPFPRNIFSAGRLQ